MELELGLKITKTVDDIASTSQYQFIKDIGPIFQSRETNTMFILTAHLKGYKKETIDIKISKDGRKISISGEKPIQEMVMMGWVMHKKMVNVKGFNKVFKIPNGVNLDKIKANYNEEEWMLNIVMPKLVKGICGLKIEEVNEQEFDKGGLELEKNKNVNDHVSSSFADTSLKGSKDSEFKHMKEGENIMEKLIDDSNKKINEDTIQKEVEESMFKNGESVGENVGKEENEVMKKLELDQSVDEFFSKKIEDTSHDKESKDEKFDNRSVEKKKFDDVNRDITRGIMKNEESKLRIEDGKLNEQESKLKMKINEGEQEYVRENDVKEGFDEAMITIKELPKNLPKSTHEESEGLNIKNMQETKNVKEQKVVKENEYFVEKGEDERNKRKVAAAAFDGSKGFNVAKKKEQKEVMKEALFESESLMENVEGEESNEEDRIEYGIIEKLKGEGSKKMDVDPFEGDTTRDKIEKEVRNKELECIDELSEKENANIGIFDGRKTQNFQDIEQTEEGAKIGKCLQKDDGEKYEKIQNNDGFKKNTTKEKHKYYLQEKNKGNSQQSKATKEDFPMTNDIQVEANGGLKNDITEDITQKESEEELKILLKVKDQQCLLGEITKGRTQETKSVKEVFPMKMLDSPSDIGMDKVKDKCYFQEETSKQRSQENKVAKEDFPMKMLDSPDDAREGLKESAEEKVKVIRQSINEETEKVVSFEKKKVVEDRKDKTQVEPNGGLRNDITKNTTQRESEEEPNILVKAKDQQYLKEDMSNGRLQESKDAKEDFPMMLDSHDDTKMVKIKEEMSKGSSQESKGTNEEFPKQNFNSRDINMKKIKDECYVHEEMSKERSQENKAAQEDFPMKMLDSPYYTNIEKIKEDMRKERSQEIKVAKEYFPTNMFDSSDVAREELKKTTEEKIKVTKGSINNKNAKVVSFEKEKVMEEKNDNTQMEAHEGLRNDITKDITRKESEEEPKILIKAKDQRCLQEKISKGRLQESKDAKKDFPMKMLDSHDDIRMEKIKDCFFQEEISKGSSQESKETNEDFRKKKFESPRDTDMEKIKDECYVQEEMSKESLQENKAAQEDFIMKMSESPNDTKMEKIKDKGYFSEDMSKGRSQEKKAAKEYFPIKMLDSPDEAREGLQETIEEKIKVTRGSINEENTKVVLFEKKKVKEEKDDKTQVEADGCLRNNITKDTTQKESEVESKILIKAKGQQYLQEKMSKGGSQKNNDAKKDFSMKMLDSHDDARDGLKGTTEEKLKVKGQKNEKTQVEKNEGLRNDITKAKTQKESTKEPKILQQCLEEEMRKRISQESNVAKEDFLMKMLDSLEDAREVLKGTTKEKIKVNQGTINEESAKVVSFVKKKIKGEKNEKSQVEANEGIRNDITKDTTQKESEEQPKIIIKAKDQQSLQEEMSKGRNMESTRAKEFPMQIEEDFLAKRKSSEICFDESTMKEEIQGNEIERISPNLFEVPKENHPKFSSVVSEGFKDFEYNGNAKVNKHKTKFESKETHESKDESMKQDILNPKKQQEVGEQVVEPLLSPKQCEVEQKDKLFLCEVSLELLKREDPTNDMQNLIGMKAKQKEILKPEIFEDVSQIGERMETKIGLKTILERGEYKTTQNVNGDKLKKQGEIIYDGDIEKVDDDKENINHETMKTINKKVHPIKYEIDEKEEEFLEASLKNNDNAQMESKRPLEQNDYLTREIKVPKIAAFEGANQQSTNEEKRKSEHVIKATKESPKINNIESEENDDSFKSHALDECELKGVKNLIENSSQQYVQDKKTYQIPKSLEENDLKKREETLIKKVEKKETNESTKPKMEYEIPKVEEEKEEERNIHVLETTISKEEDRVEQKGVNKSPPPKEPFHSIDEVAQQSKLSNSSCTQQFEVEREEEKIKKNDSKIDIQESTKIETRQEVEQCTTNIDEETKHGIEETDEAYDEVLEEQKECKDETSEGKRDNTKISKKLLVPLVIAGFVTLVVFFVRFRRARKRYNLR